MGVRGIAAETVFQFSNAMGLLQDDRLQLRDPSLEGCDDLVVSCHLSLLGTRLSEKRLE
jgi:hypothetical protein